jgi:maltose alpha-D-glucosyltransferase/alpha-amylase
LSLQKLLVVANDFVVTDFEGDLSLPLVARRQKQSPLRDVADVIVSFDQVRSVAIERAGGARPELRDRLQLAFQQWHTDAIDALLTGYRAAVQAFPGLSIDDQDAQRMLTLYQLHRLLRNLTRETALRTAANGPSINATVDALLKLVARN